MRKRTEKKILQRTPTVLKNVPIEVEHSRGEIDLPVASVSTLMLANETKTPRNRYLNAASRSLQQARILAWIQSGYDALSERIFGGTTSQ